LHVDHGHPGSFLFKAAKADASGLFFMGFVCDIDPHFRAIHRDLDETRGAAIPTSIPTNQLGFANLSARKNQEIGRPVQDEMIMRSLSFCNIGAL